MCIAVPVEVLAVDGLIARVARGGKLLDVSLLLLLGDDVKPGDFVILQAHSLAVARLDAEEARARLALFAELVPDVITPVHSRSAEDAA